MFLLGLWRSLGGLRLGTGSATGSALPSITFAASARAASISRSGSNASSSCSSDIAATAWCRTFCHFEKTPEGVLPGGKVP